MKIVINDANIFIDLSLLELLELFSQLDFELYTTDFVFEELNADQKNLVLTLKKNGKLNIIETTETTDFEGITNLLQNNNGLSFEDCSIWYYSQKLSGILLTGDSKLKTQASKSGIEVRGILYVFDEMVRQNLLNFSDAASKLEALFLLNNRLPKSEIDKRIKAWKEQQSID